MLKVKVVLFGLICLLTLSSYAQEERALALTVTQNQVTLIRAETLAGLTLVTEATTPFGAGDELRTDLYGRAYVEDDLWRGVVLPNSRLYLESYDLSPRFNADLTGRMALNLRGEFEAVEVVTPRLQVLNLSGDVFIQDMPNTPAAYVVAAQGSAEVIYLDKTYAISAETGLRFAEEVSPLVSVIGVPINPARVEGALDGCDGVVKTAGGVDLRVRAGPSEQFFYMGAIRPDTPIKIMAFASMNDGLWYRFQFLSDFGWLLGSAIQTDCQNLPQLTPQGIENALGIINWKDYEIDVLAPFFGSPDEDVWFYRR